MSGPRYRSTRGGISGLTFEEAVFEGLARDGGLLVPEQVPDVSQVYKDWASQPFHELAYELASRFCTDNDIPAADLRDIMKRSYGTFHHNDVVPCVKVGDIHFMELFHGVSFSFKDVALQALGNLYEYFLARRKRKLTIFCATSGDTGGAAIYGLRGKANVDCFVLFPDGRVSSIQQKQMTSVLDSNVHCIAVQGSFDDCQNIVKSCMADLDFKKKLALGAVNSINWSRIMSQITYYFYTYYKFFPKGDGSISFSVPTGNFGDILAGYYAKRMGLPIKNLIVATNDNDILHRFFTDGKYDKGTVHATLAPAMDIQISSNFERYLFYLFDEDAAVLAKAMEDFKNTGQLHVSEALRERAAGDFVSATASSQQIKDAINVYYEKYNHTICPHTACGVSAVDQLRSKMQWDALSKHELVVLACAHPGKFPEVVEEMTGKPPVLPKALAEAQTAETRCNVLPNSEQLVRDALEKNASVLKGCEEEAESKKRKSPDS